MEWEAPAIILSTRPYGEGDVVATVMTEEHGRHRGLARGGASRAKAALWQAGNLLALRWSARLSDQLGSFTGELIHAGAALAMTEALPLSMLSSACAVAEGALPDGEPHPRVFAGLLRLIPAVAAGEAALPDLIRWEMAVLSDLGYRLDLSACAVTGRADDLVHVSPRTGRAVSRAGAGVWSSRLLPLPAFLISSQVASLEDLRDGLRLTGHFLARDAFGTHHRPLPQARRRLYDTVATMAGRREHAGSAADNHDAAGAAPDSKDDDTSHGG